MLLAVIGMGLAVYGLVLLFANLHGGVLTAGLFRQAKLFQPRLLACSVLATAGVVGVASLSRTLSLRGSGAQVAEMLVGRLISGNPRDGLEKRLLNVVEEMAIASGMPVPQVFVLEGEAGINALAAGL